MLLCPVDLGKFLITWNGFYNAEEVSISFQYEVMVIYISLILCWILPVDIWVAWLTKSM